MRRPLLILAVATMLGCGGETLRVQGVPSDYLVDFDRRPTSADLGHMRLKPEVCQGIPLAPVNRPLEPDDFIEFLKLQNIDARVTRARSDLVFVDVKTASANLSVRFRIASTTTAGGAGHELHTALLQRGPGTWGLQRGNLAVLAPPGDTEDVILFAAQLKLPCWGVLMIAGHDDTYVVPGGYMEL